jgi:hypothetical protein
VIYVKRRSYKKHVKKYEFSQGCGSGLDPAADPDPYLLNADQNPDPGGQKRGTKVETNSELSCFELLDVLF